jgi:hypothetical protein
MSPHVCVAGGGSTEHPRAERLIVSGGGPPPRPGRGIVFRSDLTNDQSDDAAGSYDTRFRHLPRLPCAEGGRRLVSPVRKRRLRVLVRPHPSRARPAGDLDPNQARRREAVGLKPALAVASNATERRRSRCCSTGPPYPGSGNSVRSAPSRERVVLPFDDKRTAARIRCGAARGRFQAPVIWPMQAPGSAKGLSRSASTPVASSASAPLMRPRWTEQTTVW